MQAKEIVKLTEELVAPILQENNLEFVDCEFVKEGPNYYLRLYIDKEGGISINECELVSRQLDGLLSDDITDRAYILEVSSPGIDRVLKREHEYVKYKGKDVEVKLFKAVDGLKQYDGVLVGLIDDNVVIKTENGELSFNRKDVSSTRLAVKF
jgi:ribosome maturation factor RimP